MISQPCWLCEAVLQRNSPWHFCSPALGEPEPDTSGTTRGAGRSCHLTSVPAQRLLEGVEEVRKRGVTRPQTHAIPILAHSRKLDPVVRDQVSRTEQAQGVSRDNGSVVALAPIGDAEARVIEGSLLVPDALIRERLQKGHQIRSLRGRQADGRNVHVQVLPVRNGKVPAPVIE